MEGVAFALDRQVATLCASGRPTEIRSCGGAARSNVWLQIKADVLNVPFVATECPEPTSLGTALLAGQALGWGEVTDLARRWVRPTRRFEPDPETHRVYAGLRPS
jgi:xylulokinase